jgi:hypothetical protein
MVSPRRTNAQLEAENAALRRFFFDLDLSREREPAGATRGVAGCTAAALRAIHRFKGC